ncbi:alpha/beta-hydrolase [Cryphonectria parasitica EP155]|uniref:Alpha/beta-hydrolase n=1 Tax=Cryphonectria parasitica (strain ATCC 38755 / EP155) TaxID=660469 RepID=A0A9P5CQ82_CRYP1|nr:alpha/beta-hydrolase [Cryphonectria parasitica EP155]KAF3765770.1 alpha/beta-hydrolase [Cryphonectria parasitica EP155]
MQIFILALALAASITALPTSEIRATEDNQCSNIQIPVTVSEKRSILNITIQDDWDAAALTFNLTARDFGTPDDPLPIVGETSSAVGGNYTVAATLCGTGSTMLVVTHGIIESKLYFQPNLSNAEQYSFVDAALAAGYSVLNYDRIGVGSSSKVDAYSDAQFPVEVSVLNSLVTYARQTTGADKVVLVGHSYGAYISVQSAATLATSVDGLVLTGFSGTLEYFAAFGAGVGFRVASLQDPARWGALGTGYLTSSDLYAETFAYFASPYFERRVAEWAYEVEGEPFAVAELPTLLATEIAYGNVTAPTLVLQGRYDTSACGGDCVGLLDGLSANFTGAAALQTVDDLDSGHDLFLHRVAPQAFEMIFDFLSAQGV